MAGLPPGRQAQGRQSLLGAPPMMGGGRGRGGPMGHGHHGRGGPMAGGPPPSQMGGMRGATPSVLGQSNEIRIELPVPDEILNDSSINFVGMMIGPGGSTQREMETQTGAKVNVRGKGCREAGQDTDPEKPMYVLIRGDAQHKVEAMKAIVMELFSSKQKREALKAAQMRQRDAGQMSMGRPFVAPMGSNASGGLMPTGSVAQVGNGQIRELLMIPASKVGIVIGRGGETIQAIQRNSGANVQVQREHAPAHPETREVTITGTPPQIESAKAEIQKHCVGQRSQPGVINATDHIMVPQNVVGIIIGRGGETIKRLQQQTEAGIQVQPEHLTQPGATERKVNLSGSDDQIAAAKREIMELVERHRDSPYMHENVGHLSETVAVPVNCIGLIIGKGGDMVKQIAERTNTRIQVQKDDQLDAQYVAQKASGTHNNNGPPTQFRNVSIRGDRPAIDAAKQELQAIVDEHAQRHGYDAPQLTQPMHQYFGMTPVAYRDYLKQMHDHYGMNEQQVIDYYQQALQQYQAAAAQYADPNAAAVALQQQQMLTAASAGVAATATGAVAATAAMPQQQLATAVPTAQAGAVMAATQPMVAQPGTQPQMVAATQPQQQWGQAQAQPVVVQQTAAAQQPWAQQAQPVQQQQPVAQQWGQPAQQVPQQQPQQAPQQAQQPQQFNQQQQPTQQWNPAGQQQQPPQQQPQQPQTQQWGNNQQAPAAGTQQAPPQQQWGNTAPPQQQQQQQQQQQGGPQGGWSSGPQQGSGGGPAPNGQAAGSSSKWSNAPQQGGAPGPSGPGGWNNGPQGGGGRGGGPGGRGGGGFRGGFRGRGGAPPDFQQGGGGGRPQRDGYSRNGDRRRRD